MLRTTDPDSKLNAIADFVLDKLQKGEDAPSKREIMRSFSCRLSTADSGIELAKERLIDTA